MENKEYGKIQRLENELKIAFARIKQNTTRIDGLESDISKLEKSNNIQDSLRQAKLNNIEHDNTRDFKLVRERLQKLEENQSHNADIKEIKTVDDKLSVTINRLDEALRRIDGLGSEINALKLDSKITTSDLEAHSEELAYLEDNMEQLSGDIDTLFDTIGRIEDEQLENDIIKLHDEELEERYGLSRKPFSMEELKLKTTENIPLRAVIPRGEGRTLYNVDVLNCYCTTVLGQPRIVVVYNPCKIDIPPEGLEMNIHLTFDHCDVKTINSGLQTVRGEFFSLCFECSQDSDDLVVDMIKY